MSTYTSRTSWEADEPLPKSPAKKAFILVMRQRLAARRQPAASTSTSRPKVLRWRQG